MKIPEQVWAVALAVLGVAMEVTLLFARGASEATRHDAHAAAFVLVAGAVGAFKAAGAGKDATPPAQVNSKEGNGE